ncbi:MAG TPA: SGNH/GDSL hydrolase family protein [Pseudonocardiaceae bacterium]|nr:SGNH/GDSL hydrolase family protein [Pseudonocardiaceae bacterium]
MPLYRRVMFATITTVLAMLGVPASAAAKTLGLPRHYVALGDSYTAGPLIPLQRTDPVGCERSTNNYPSLLAAALGIRDFTDTSCSGAKTDNMTAAQSMLLLDSNPPQFTALRPDTDLVTLTIGGNDIGFTEMVYTCARAAALDPLGNPCQREATAGGSDIYAQRIAAVAPKVGAMLEGIHQRSPHAMVVLVGYLRILPPTGGCYPVMPIARGDVPYLDGFEQQLNAMLASQASRHDAVFVDSYARSEGHDTCQLPGVKWVEAVTPTSPAAPVHPNAAGMRAVAGFALDTLRRVAAPVG